MRQAKSHFRILLYHSISDNHRDPYAVTIENFKNQIDWIKNNDYNVVSLQEAVQNNSLPRPLVLTFDDGFSDILDNAIPLLDKYNFKATIFIVVSQVGKTSTWRAGGLNKHLADWRALKELVERGYSIGSHGFRHNDLTKLTQDEVDEEMVVSKKIIQERLDIKIDSFSYPWGACTNREIDSVKRAGYNFAVGLSADEHYEISPFLLERIVVEERDSLQVFVRKLR